MKPTLKAALVALALTSSAAFADFSPEQLLEVTKLAVDDFKATQGEHAEHFYGYKAWKSGGEARVKVYAQHEGATLEFNYNCHNHGGELECHAQ